MQYTENLKLKIPDLDENFKLSDSSENWQLIDENSEIVTEHLNNISYGLSTIQKNVGIMGAAINEIGAIAENSAKAIITDAQGENIKIIDSVDKPMFILNIYGKSIQDGAPTPQNPISFTNVGDDGEIEVYVSDESENSQTRTLNVESPLYGIPVTTGGNYIDGNGQAWICDEIDFEKGVYIKRTEKKKFTLTKQVYTTSPLGYRYTAFATLGSDFCLCEQLPYNANAATHLTTTDGIRCAAQYGTIAAQYTDTAGDTQTLAVDVLYVLANPVETPLTSEQIEALEGFHSYCPDTIVTNDSNAGVKVNYTADTKRYIDHKFAELSSAILGGN